MNEKETIFADIFVITSKGVKQELHYYGVTRDELKSYMHGITQGMGISSGYIGHAIAVVNNNAKDVMKVGMNGSLEETFYTYLWNNDLYNYQTIIRKEFNF